MGMTPDYWLSKARELLAASMWLGHLAERGLGFIIYLAAISSIDPTLYEAAKVDGAGRFRQIRQHHLARHQPHNYCACSSCGWVP